jgi:hypothetical protein
MDQLAHIGVADLVLHRQNVCSYDPGWFIFMRPAGAPSRLDQLSILDR